MATEKYGSVFAAHPEVNELHVAKDEQGNEQAFIERTHAINFAKGNPDNVEVVKRQTEKKEAEPKPKKAAEVAE
jgi:hypothetical protein